MPYALKGLSQKFNNELVQKVGDPGFYAPSIKLSVIYKGEVRFRWEYGDDYRYFDLASLTKILFTAPIWMRLLYASKMDVKDEVRHYLPWWNGAGSTTIEELLTHTGGVTWWKPYYELIGQGLKHKEAWQKLRGLLSTEAPNKNERRAIYSDLDLFFLGFLAEELFQKDLLSLWEDVSERFRFKGLHFQNHERSRFSKSLYAPTEFSEWRQKQIQAEVHDDNAFALGGVAPHAGLFGRIQDVERYVLILRALLRSEEGEIRLGFDQKTLLDFTERKTKRSIGDFGYIFWKPTKGASSSGRFFDDSSFGHTGFTGTSLWYSLKKDFGVILLSNRVYYGREIELFRHFRPLVHDIAAKLIL